MPVGPLVEHYVGQLFAISADRRTVAWFATPNELSVARAEVRGREVKLTPGLSLRNVSTGPPLALSADGSRVLMANRDGGFGGGWSVFDTATGETVTRLREKSGTQLSVQSAAFSPDARWLAVGTRVAVRVYDADTGRERAWVGGGDPDRGRFAVGSVGGVAFSPDGTKLAAAIGEGSGPKIAVWPAAAFTGGRN